MHMGKTPKLPSHPGPGVSSVLGRLKAALGTAVLRGSPAATSTIAESSTPQDTLTPTEQHPLASHDTGKQRGSRTEWSVGLSCWAGHGQEMWGCTLEGREGGVLVWAPTELCTRTATATPRSSERDRERQEGDVKEWCDKKWESDR